MSPHPSIPESLWNTVSPEAQAAILAVLEALEKRIADLEARLNQNSTNSSKPPSTGPPAVKVKRRPPAPPSGRKRGGQPGHKRHTRALVAPDQIRETFEVKPAHCGGCGAALRGHDPDPARHQVAEIPPIRPDVDEYRLHRLTCSCCGTTTRAELPAGVPTGPLGPRPRAILAMFAGSYRLAKRPIQQLASDLFGPDVSLGMISKLERRAAEVLGPVAAEVAAAIKAAPSAHIDETSWAEANEKAWLRVGLTDDLTAFTIADNRGAGVARSILGTDKAKVVISDRFSSYDWIEQHQYCWSHLRRDSQAMIDRRDGGSAVGSGLLGPSGRLFHWWHKYRDGVMAWSTFLGHARPIRWGVKQALSRGVSCSGEKTAATCRMLLEGEEHLWTSLRMRGIEPTDSAAERALRHAVSWRKSSGGTASEWGSRSVERVLSVAGTCRQQWRNVLEFPTRCFRSQQSGQGLPSLPKNQASVCSPPSMTTLVMPGGP
jgi:transposase